MSRFPSLSIAADALPYSIFARLYERLASYDGEYIPFHIGDTYLEPPEASRLGALGFASEGQPELYSYSQASGDAHLIDALVDKVRRDNRMGFARTENIQITAGATHALSCCMRAVLDPGDEMLLLAPYWPLARGITKSCAVRPVEVPYLGGAGDLEELLESRVTGRTTALYLCNPNNPDGKVLGSAELATIARFAERHHLWVLSDEVYEKFVFDGVAHTSIATLPGMAGRTMTAFSFSKSYGQAGLRVGYVVGPSSAIMAVRKMANHTVYSVPRAMQRAALAALEHGAEFLVDARVRYQRARDLAVSRVAAPCPRPQGSTYLFLDLSQWVGPSDDCTLVGGDGPSVLERMAEAGLLLAPGVAFGSDYGNWARLCYSSVPEERLLEGIDRLNAVLAGLDRASAAG